MAQTSISGAPDTAESETLNTRTAFMLHRVLKRWVRVLDFVLDAGSVLRTAYQLGRTLRQLCTGQRIDSTLCSGSTGHYVRADTG
eukprot:3754803-Rhodomonas_salina.2